MATIAELVRIYHVLGQRISELEAKREKVKTIIKQSLARKKLESVDIAGPTPLRAQLYPISKSSWDVTGLIDYLTKAKLDPQRFLVVSVNERALNDAAERGEVELEAIGRYVTVKRSYGFRVDKIAES